MSDMILQFLMWVVAKNPQIAALIVMMGTMRLMMKPIMTALKMIVDATPWELDDQWYAKIVDSKAYKAITWLLDYVGSIKMPQAPKDP